MVYRVRAGHILPDGPRASPPAPSVTVFLLSILSHRQYSVAKNPKNIPLLIGVFGRPSIEVELLIGPRHFHRKNH